MSKEAKTQEPDKAEIFVGVQVAHGEAYFAVVRAPAEVLLGDPLDRIVPTAQVDRPEVLGDFRDRVAQELRRLRPAAVGVGYTRKYKQWTAADAFKRFTLDAAVMLAAVDLGIHCEQVRQEDAAKAVGVAPTKMAEQAAARLGIDPPKYWADRVWATATAVHVAKTHA